jgi:MoaA/NifB/PqqE/SkfB family radical SAM enzyme
MDLELVEKDVRFFRKAYEVENYCPMKYLILPVTYRCNLSCKYCYAHSNYKHKLPDDRSINRLVEIVKTANCQTVNLAGGEPTVRDDLLELLTALKKRTSVKRLCVVTNGQRTTNENYLKTLHESGMDFLFLPLYIPGYKQTGTVMGKVIKSIDNAYRLKIPVWIQAAVERIQQIGPVLEIVEKYHKTIFNITIRSVRPYGITEPGEMVYVSDIIRYLGKENDYGFGNHPFNRHVKLFGRTTKVSYWVNDRKKLDPYDALYVIHDDTILPFHKGMIHDDIFFKAHKLHC